MMHEQNQNYACTYRNKSEDELDRLLQDLDDLEEDAQSALISELKVRGRTEAEVSPLIAKGRNNKLPLSSIEWRRSSAQLPRPRAGTYRFKSEGAKEGSKPEGHDNWAPTLGRHPSIGQP